MGRGPAEPRAHGHEGLEDGKLRRPGVDGNCGASKQISGAIQSTVYGIYYTCIFYVCIVYGIYSMYTYII